MDVLEQAEDLRIDLDALMRIIVRSTEVRDSDALLKLIGTDVTEIFRHEVMPGSYGTDSADGSHVHNVSHRNYHPDYFNALATKETKSDSSPVQHWRTSQEPIAFQIGRDDQEYPSTWINIFKKYGLRNTADHGALDVQRMFGSHFIFSNISEEAGKREIFLLKLLTPYLHFALMRTLNTAMEFHSPAESSQEPPAEQQKEIDEP